MEIRPFEPTDESAVIQLWKDCGLLVQHNNPFQDIQRKLNVNPEWFLIGVESDEIMASCMVGYDGHRGWINYLAVAPIAQRQGHASRLMAEAERLLNQAGCPKINLQIRASNRSVAAFYESLGFKQDPVISLGKRLEVDVRYLV